MAQDTQHNPPNVHLHKDMLLTDDASSALLNLSRALRAAGYEIDWHQLGNSTMADVENVSIAAVLVGNRSAAATQAAPTWLQRLPPHVPVVVVSNKQTKPTLTYPGAPTGEPQSVQNAGERSHHSPMQHALATASAQQSLVTSTQALTGPRYALAAEFDVALASLFMAYQPIVDCAHGSLFGYEALVRCAPGNLASPPALLAAAESLGRLQDLSRQIRATVAVNLSAAPAQVLEQKIFVNLHAQDLLDPALFDPTAPMSRHAHRIVLEITERTPLEEVPEVLPRIAKLRELGYRIALDDLGAGYAGLSTFAQLEPEVVKLDMALVRQVEKSRTKRHIIVALVQLCEKLNIHVIAEGIESIAERDVLMALGCQLLQGYYFGRPEREFLPPTF